MYPKKDATYSANADCVVCRSRMQLRTKKLQLALVCPVCDKNRRSRMRLQRFKKRGGTRAAGR
jgi:ribosomal protein L44E